MCCFAVLAVFVQSRGWKHNSIASSIPRFKPSLLLPVCGCYMVYWWHPVDLFVTLYQKKQHISTLMPINPEREAHWGAGNLGGSLPDVLQSDGAVSAVPPVRCQQGARDARRRRPIRADSQVRRSSTDGQQ